LRTSLGTSEVFDALQNVSRIDEKTRDEIEEALASYLADSSEAPKAANELMIKLSNSRKNEAEVVRNSISSFVPNNRIDAAVIHIILF
jgi:hypothetical protein